MAHNLQNDWDSLYLGSLYRFNSLTTTKDQFCDMTVREIEEFLCTITEFVKRFENEGPGSCGEDLDSGLMKMEVLLLFSKIILI